MFSRGKFQPLRLTFGLPCMGALAIAKCFATAVRTERTIFPIFPVKDCSYLLLRHQRARTEKVKTALETFS